MTTPRTALLRFGPIVWAACTLCAGHAPARAESASEGRACRTEEIIPARALGTSERTVFTDEGRVFIIGTRASALTVPLPTANFGSFVFEVVRRGTGYALAEYVGATLDGTAEGKVGGTPRGGECIFTGLTVAGSTLYAGCASLQNEGASLVQIDTRAETVRAGRFTSCNFEPAIEPCTPTTIIPNGMAVDQSGRIYVTNMPVNLLPDDGQSGHSIAQIEVRPGSAEPGTLDFVHRAWLPKNFFVDGVAPNGVQIRDGVLYYVGGANLNAVPIQPDGRAGKLRVQVRGPLLSYNDDFAFVGEDITFARTLPSAVVGVAGTGRTTGRTQYSCPMTEFVPSSIAVTRGEGPFPTGTMIVTSFFGGGLFALH